MTALSAADVSAAARATLMQFLPAHLAALPRPLPTPTNYEALPTPEAVRRVQGSVLAVVVSGTVGDPDRRGDGSYEATFSLSVAVWHQNTEQMPILTAASDYVAAVRDCLLQRRSLGGVAKSTTWLAESFDLIGDALTPNTLGLGIVEFAVLVSNAQDMTPPTGPGTTVLSTAVSVSSKEE